MVMARIGHTYGVHDMADFNALHKGQTVNVDGAEGWRFKLEVIDINNISNPRYVVLGYCGSHQWTLVEDLELYDETLNKIDSDIKREIRKK